MNLVLPMLPIRSSLQRFFLYLALVGLLALAVPAHAARIDTQSFDDRIRLADTELVLNGMGLRAVAWLKGYAAGLYLAEKATTPAAVLAQKGPKRVQMKLMVDVASAEFVKAFDKGMQRNHSPAEQAALAARGAQFDRVVGALGKLKKGDVIDLDYLPARGLVLSLNGKPRGDAIPGEDFYLGVLKIFIGQDPVDPRLKAGLLGGKA